MFFVSIASLNFWTISRSVDMARRDGRGTWLKKASGSHGFPLPFKYFLVASIRC